MFAKPPSYIDGPPADFPFVYGPYPGAGVCVQGVWRVEGATILDQYVTDGAATYQRRNGEPCSAQDSGINAASWHPGPGWYWGRPDVTPHVPNDPKRLYWHPIADGFYFEPAPPPGWPEHLDTPDALAHATAILLEGEPISLAEFAAMVWIQAVTQLNVAQGAHFNPSLARVFLAAFDRDAHLRVVADADEKAQVAQATGVPLVQGTYIPISGETAAGQMAGAAVADTPARLRVGRALLGSALGAAGGALVGHYAPPMGRTRARRTAIGAGVGAAAGALAGALLPTKVSA